MAIGQLSRLAVHLQIARITMFCDFPPSMVFAAWQAVRLTPLPRRPAMEYSDTFETMDEHVVSRKRGSIAHTLGDTLPHPDKAR